MRRNQKALECLRVPRRAAAAATENVVALLQETRDPSVSVRGSGWNVVAEKKPPNKPAASHLEQIHYFHVTAKR